MKSILLLGQSNMAGRGFLNEVPAIINEHIHVLRNGRWQMMGEPIHADRHLAGVGLASSFAQAWSIDHPNESIGLIPCAEGGSAISEWQPGSVLMRHALSEARFAQETSEIIGILWHQGENDCNQDLYQVYESQLKNVIAHVRKGLDLPHVPFIIGGLDHLTHAEGFSRTLTQHAEINHILQTMPQQVPDTYFVTSKWLTMNPDGIHFNAQSLRRFGLRYYEAFKTLTSLYEPLKDEARRVEALYERPFSKNEQMRVEYEKLATGQISFETFSERLKS
ncbi:sialate O-acetylesterase [Staphylococcus simulans]|uniref:sialate O-acetylesterase n=1 Tax=Staphylococcus simulans TaxID=1286 RepID=UPI0021CE08A8|nr:sialate O-acetylesterase [Staphylococcus simulans]UXR50178.1 sialate O-acetylesterase [Staphylococcus simulans]